MSLNKSYIYIRDNIWYNSENIFKVGITTSIKDRSSTYITGELYRGFYVKIYELKVSQSTLKLIDNIITGKFKKDYNVYFDGGTEFYDRKIINMIEDFDLGLRFLKKYGYIHNMSEVLLKYRLHDEQVTHQGGKEGRPYWSNLRNELIQNIIFNDNNSL